jgi:hypothetical protein
MGIEEARASRARSDAEGLGDLCGLQPDVVTKHEERALIRRQAPEAALQSIPVCDGDLVVGDLQTVERELAHRDREAPRPGRLGVARVDQCPVEPDPESVRIAEAGKLTPGDHQRLLHRVLGPIVVAKDPARDPEEPIAVRAGEDGEGLPVPTLRGLDEIVFHHPSGPAVDPPFAPQSDGDASSFIRRFGPVGRTAEAIVVGAADSGGP